MTAPKRPASTFDGVIWRVDHLLQNLGDGAATTDNLRNLATAVREMAEACARQEINGRVSDADRMLAMIRSKP